MLKGFLKAVFGIGADPPQRTCPDCRTPLVWKLDHHDFVRGWNRVFVCEPCRTVWVLGGDRRLSLETSRPMVRRALGEPDPPPTPP